MAKNAPYCFCCGRSNDGTIVAAHSNQIRDQKGKGIKAHDFRVAFVTIVIIEIDQGNKSKEKKNYGKRRIVLQSDGYSLADGLETKEPSIYE